MKSKKVLGAAVVAALTVFTGTAAANGAHCKGLNGYDKEGNGSAEYSYFDPISQSNVTVTTVWGAIKAANYSFSGRRLVGECKVKDQPWTGTVKPRSFPTYVVATGIPQDGCSLYKISADLRWSIEQLNPTQAWMEAIEIKNLATTMTTNGYVDAVKGAAIRAAAERVEMCLQPMAM